MAPFNFAHYKTNQKTIIVKDYIVQDDSFTYILITPIPHYQSHNYNTTPNKEKQTVAGT